MANLNPAPYANGGITIPNGLVGMPNNPRAMHLAMTQNPIGFPTMLTANMNSQRQIQMPMGQNPSPPVTRNPVSYLRPSGRSILRVLLFGDYLAGEYTQNKKDIGYWKKIVFEFFSEEGRMIYGLWSPESGNRSFDIPYPVISRFFQVNFESGVTSIQLSMNSIKENFTTPVSIANNCMAYNSTVEAKASLIYNYEDGSRVVASGRLKVRLNHNLKIDCFEFNTEKHMEYVPRQQTMLPESPIGPMGIPIKTLRCLEVAEGVVTLHDLIEKSISSSKGPIATLYAITNPEQQSQTIINQSNHTPPTPGPSPPEPPAKTPKEKAENLNLEQHYNNTDMPAPSPSTSNTNIKNSPTSKSSAQSPVFSKMDTPKQKRRPKPQPRKNSRQETGS
ncbi:hypothetical protein RclHR1_18700001 [Rhizophagus clarus]|uniref:LIM interaction domain-containing protein n=1 Tax=Rhizophagus clarus TaxID=94130 RepID=A0A2Z6R1H7_9GLOM|nr:hypothetical protein RclHR1_18700001 [Rhizophagus clarus]GES96602.1 hypothetical protein RCL_jg14623.t2 [Rhizophagus clarus]